jgi:ATP synthase protein I
MSDDPTDKLKDLEARIEAARAVQAPPPRKPESKFAGAGLAWRLMFELIVGIVIGCAMGWGLDSLFGTLPLFLVVFTLLGFGAGVRVMLQSAQEGQRKLNADAAKTAGPDGSNGAVAPTDKGRQRGG